MMRALQTPPRLRALAAALLLALGLAAGGCGPGVGGSGTGNEAAALAAFGASAAPVCSGEIAAVLDCRPGTGPGAVSIPTLPLPVVLADRADSRAGTFSGGMKRRLNLAVAVVHRPKLLFLDEPTTGVDPQSRNYIFTLVQKLNAEGMTVVYTSHYMEEVQTLCKRIAILDHGKVVACDTLAGLLRILEGTVVLRVGRVDALLLERLAALPQVRIREVDGDAIGLVCGDAAKAVVGAVGVLNELRVELTGLEAQEPNLERVFLHLTGRELRD